MTNYKVLSLINIILFSTAAITLSYSNHVSGSFATMISIMPTFLLLLILSADYLALNEHNGVNEFKKILNYKFLTSTAIVLLFQSIVGILFLEEISVFILINATLVILMILLIYKLFYKNSLLYSYPVADTIKKRKWKFRYIYTRYILLAIIPLIVSIVFSVMLFGNPSSGSSEVISDATQNDSYNAYRSISIAIYSMLAIFGVPGLSVSLVNRRKNNKRRLIIERNS